jgi:hypothetical protein
MRDRVEELTLRFADGLATEAEIDELERLVAADPEAARVHVHLMELEGELRGGREDLDLVATILERIRRAREDRIERGVMERVRRSPRRMFFRMQRPRSLNPAWALAAAALLAAGLLVLWGGRAAPAPKGPAPLPEVSRGPEPPPPPPIPEPSQSLPVPPSSRPGPPVPAPPEVPPAPEAPPAPRTEPPPSPPPPSPTTTQVLAATRLEKAEGEVIMVEGAVRSPAEVGTTFPTGRTLVTGKKGRAAVAWPDGTVMNLGPEAQVRHLEGKGRSKALFLEKGAVAVAAAGPMAVHTANAEAEVLGTRFSVSTSKDSTRVEVREGKVRLTRLSDRKSVEVPAGHSAAVAPGAALAAHALDVLPEPPAGHSWVVVFEDEFDDARVDRARWNVAEEVRKAGVWHSRNVQTDGEGHLVLTTSRVGDRFVSGGLNTVGKFEQAFGYFVARVQFQGQPGHRPSFGLACRLSPAGGRDGTLISIVEKAELTDLVHHFMNWGGSGTVWARWDVPAGGIMKGWHAFGLWWTPDEYVFYVDGRETWRNRHGGVSQVRQHLFISDEVDESAGDIRKAVLPDRFLVDSVRAYALVPNAGEK